MKDQKQEIWMQVTAGQGPAECARVVVKVRRPDVSQTVDRDLDITGRLDHIFYSGQLHCFLAHVNREGASDHYPVMAVMGARFGQGLQWVSASWSTCAWM